MGKLEGKLSLITGGNSGIGLAGQAVHKRPAQTGEVVAAQLREENHAEHQANHGGRGVVVGGN
jgi:NAD(P)-dependent dehydrogenase (short-subunit alcohol dehydrogenase family)